MYALSNFMLVFLSCAFTVFILRLHYKQPLALGSKFNRLPICVKVFLFKYLAPNIFIKINRPKRNKLSSLNSLDERENKGSKLLEHLKQFNSPITNKIIDSKFQTKEQRLIFEEWKIAALILDR